MRRPLLILDQHFRRVEEIFSSDVFAALAETCRIEGAENCPMPLDRLDDLATHADFLVAARPALTQDQVAGAKNLKAVIEVAGAFQDGLDYEACFARGIEVLSCAPGFRQSVAEMGLAMMLGAARGLVAEHEAFRSGTEGWLEDRENRDLSLFRQSIGFVGYGNIARELHRLLRPFSPKIFAYDPWLNKAPADVTLTDLKSLFARTPIVVVTAVPTADNRALVDRELISSLPRGGKLVLLSRAHCVDFDAAVDAAKAGRIVFATDVFPSEPLAATAELRHCPNVILSPHRAAAVKGGRHLIGEFILHDIRAILSGDKQRELLPANGHRVAGLVAAQRQIRAAGTLTRT